MEVPVFKGFGHVETFKYAIWIQRKRQSVIARQKNEERL